MDENGRPEPVIDSIRVLYHHDDFKRGLALMKQLIKEYNNFQSYPNFCGWNWTDEPCPACVQKCLQFMAEVLTNLLRMTQSTDKTEELLDFQQLSQVAKEMPRVEGHMGHYIYVLLDRKCNSLNGSMVATYMSRKHWRVGNRITERQYRLQQEDLAEISGMKPLGQRTPSAETEVDEDNTTEERNQITEEQDRPKQESEPVRQDPVPSEDPEVPTPSTLDCNVVNSGDTEGSEPPTMLGLIDGNTDDEGEQAQRLPPMTLRPSLTREAAISGRMGNLTGDGSEMDTAAAPCSSSEVEEEENVSPGVYSSSYWTGGTPAVESPPGEEAREDVTPPIQVIRGLDFDVVEREPTEVRAPVPPSLLRDTSNRDMLERRAAPRRRARGLDFNVIERDVSGTRTPSSPRFRRR